MTPAGCGERASRTRHWRRSPMRRRSRPTPRRLPVPRQQRTGGVRGPQPLAHEGDRHRPRAPTRSAKRCRCRRTVACTAESPRRWESEVRYCLPSSLAEFGGPNGIRTHDLRNASAALFRLSYRPSATPTGAADLSLSWGRGGFRRTRRKSVRDLPVEISPVLQTSCFRPQCSGASFSLSLEERARVRVAASLSTNAGANQHHLSCSRNQIQEA